MPKYLNGHFEWNRLITGVMFKVSKMLWKDHVNLGSQNQAHSIEYGPG